MDGDRLIKARQMVKKQQRSSIYRAFADSLIIGRRNLILLGRFPAAIVSIVLIPTLFLSGFLLTFERLMLVQGINYVQYLLPIIIIQAMFFTAMGSAINLASDLQIGMVQRCRAMPVSRLAVFGGLLIAYLVRGAISATILIYLAHFYGFRFQTGWLSIVGFMALILLFTTTAIAGYAVLTLIFKEPELVNSLSLVPYAPLLLLSTGFSPAENFPSWLQPIVRNQPISHIANALRSLAASDEFLHPLLWSLAWLLGVLAIFVLLIAWLYEGATR